jgi:PleD family two-component response regulator
MGDVPEWDLVRDPVRPNIRATMQTSHFSPIPPHLRSGPALPVARSAPQPRTIRVLIGDEDQSFRRGLRASFALDPRLEVVGEAWDGAQALELLRVLRPDVALVDEDMPSFGGAAIARIIRSELPDTRVVVLTRNAIGGG